jgi:thioredoxin 1
MTETPDHPVALSTGDELRGFIATHERTLVEFHTKGCSICASMEPVLDGVSRTAGVAVGTMNPRDDPPLVDQYDVRSVPKLLAFVDGDLTGTREGEFMGVDEVRAFLVETTDLDAAT